MSKREKQVSYINAYMWNLIRDGIDDLSYKAETETQTERTNMQIPRGSRGWAELEYWEDTRSVDEYTFAQLFGRVQLFAALWPMVRQAPLCMGFPRQEYWSRLPFPTLEDLSDY